jgi:hypothetical protein
LLKIRRKKEEAGGRRKKEEAGGRRKEEEAGRKFAKIIFEKFPD